MRYDAFNVVDSAALRRFQLFQLDEGIMRGMLCTVCAAAILVASGSLGHRAQATTLAAPSALHIAAVQAVEIQQVANVCGSNGCALVQTKRVQHQKPGAVAAKHI